VQLGMIGLGRMGGNMTERLRERGHDVQTYDPGVDSTAKSLEELRDQLTAPRTFWMMVPAGKITEDTFQTLLGLAADGDVIVDGGNSNFHDSQRRHAEALAKGISFVDAGVSGGVWGLKNGYCLMVGGEDAAVAQAEPIFLDRAHRRLRARRAVGRGPLREDGAQRHRVRADAGVRRGLRGDERVGVRPRPARDRWDLALRLGRALVAARAPLRRVRGGRPAPREGQGLRRGLRRGPVDDRRGDREDVPVPVITAALFARFASRQDESFAAKVNASLRNQFGGHAVRSES
jgi:Predicted 6-phosphogluconate dehydrogenase